MRLRHAGIALVAVALGACAAPQRLAKPPLRTEATLAGLEFGKGGQWPNANWWKHYEDPQLDELVLRALAKAPPLKIAEARFQSAREAVRAVGAAAGVRVDADASFARERLSENGLFPPEFLGFTWYNQADLGLSASYSFDWWGKRRALIDAALDSARASAVERQAAALALASDVAATYFGWQADEARLALQREKLANDGHAITILEGRAAAGLDAGDALDGARAARSRDADTLTEIETSARLRLIALAALLDSSPAELPKLELRPLPHTESSLPDNLSLDLLARRPDIAASRWRVDAARRISDATRAEFFPDVRLKALFAVQSLQVSNLLQKASEDPAVTAAVHLPIFDGALRQARFRANRAELEAAVADYENTVIAAAQDVAVQATTRSRYITQRDRNLEQLDSLEHVFAIETARQNQGLFDARKTLSASQTVLDQRQRLVQIDLAAVTADIALQQALGGGFKSGPDTEALD